MSEFLIKFWTKSGMLSGARIFASSASQAIQIAKDTYDAANITSWQLIR